MKFKLFSLALLLMFAGHPLFSQQSAVNPPASGLSILPGTPVLSFSAPDREKLRAEDAARQKNGQSYRFAVPSETFVTESNSGMWSTDANGNRIWQLHIKHKGAEALSFLFSNFQLFDASTFDVFDKKGKKLHKTLTAADVHEHLQQHIALCFGDEMTLQLTEPQLSRKSVFQLDQVLFGYRATGNPSAEKDLNDSGTCEVNVNCSPAGDPWQDEKRGVVRILVVDNMGAAWCSGSLVNNLGNNCKPYVLTAQHCGVNVTANQFNQWIFNFGYESPGCANLVTDSAIDVDAKRFTGCFQISKSGGVNGQDITSSDFQLVQIGTPATEAAVIAKLKSAAISAYWNGWDANNTPATNGAGIHHPAGDIKKLSTFTGTLVSNNYSPGASNTHWEVVWTSNANGFGVTEGGSSGSPIFNTNGGNSRIVGTLSGGGSTCETPESSDLYGKMSYHWTANGTASTSQLKPFLDPGNTGILICNGSSDPCATPNTAPTANFAATPVTVAPGGIVSFTDLSTNAPTGWSWSITPATGWSYTNSTSTSQSPQVTFTTQGTYTVSLTVSNAFGSDNETKTNYITVTIVTQPCNASSTACDEYISTVKLESINNTSACTNYTSYTTPQATLNKGSEYTLSIAPSVDGQEGAYPEDEIAAWIDWNHNFDFNDPGERVAYVLVTPSTPSAWPVQFTITVPQSASSGQLSMRVRISDKSQGVINPCGVTQFGEVEDYVVFVPATPLSVDETQVQGLMMYPNPGTDFVTVESDETGPLHVAITDITGKLIASREISNKEAIDISSLAKGSYLFRITSGTKMTVRPFVKQ